MMEGHGPTDVSLQGISGEERRPISLLSPTVFVLLSNVPLEAEEMEHNVSTNDFHAIKAFVSLQFFGMIGMFILLSSALLSQTRILRRVRAASTPNEVIIRSRTWFSFCISWIISCFSYCLLFFAGKQMDPSQPPSYGLCLTQAALIYSSPPLRDNFCTLLRSVVDVPGCFDGEESWAGKNDEDFVPCYPVCDVASYNGRTSHCQLILVTQAFVQLIIVFQTGGVQPDIVERNLVNDPFCVMKPNAIPIVISLLTLMFALAVLGMLVLLSVKLHRTRKENAHWNPSRNQEQLVALTIRMMVFGFCGVIAMVISTVFLFNRSPGVKSDLALAILPPIGVIVFGSQKDFLRFWSGLFTSFARSVCPCLCSPRQQPVEQLKSQDKSKAQSHPEVLEMEIVPQGGIDDGTFLVLPHDEERGLVSPRRMRLNVE
ncbi:hypothetical protein D9757_008821 [Collybiopsis confluens]|uniref:Uncharacterized protein n=1 Tax=Collybiopsis confluens TaxID=2823264 RepID=A0A8H5LZQ9_9AGAR|nr:hypothetical protein D9757_008821 [Collybiopsis confluens]